MGTGRLSGGHQQITRTTSNRLVENNSLYEILNGTKIVHLLTK